MMQTPTAAMARDTTMAADVLAASVLSPPESLWSAIEAKVDRRRRRVRVWRLSLAASVIVAAGLVTLVARQGADRPESGAGLDRLIEQSRALETRRQGVVIDPHAWSPAAQGLALRIADVDDELWRVGSVRAAETARLESLWATRVQLLEALLEEERASNVRPDFY
jgi:hypothetical protein